MAKNYKGVVSADKLWFSKDNVEDVLDDDIESHGDMHLKVIM